MQRLLRAERKQNMNAVWNTGTDSEGTLRQRHERTEMRPSCKEAENIQRLICTFSPEKKQLIVSPVWLTVKSDTGGAW